MIPYGSITLNVVAAIIALALGFVVHRYKQQTRRR